MKLQSIWSYVTQNRDLGKSCPLRRPASVSCQPVGRSNVLAELRAELDACEESQNLAKSKRSKPRTAVLEELEREVDELAVKRGGDHCRGNKAYAELETKIDTFEESQKIVKSKRSKHRATVLEDLEREVDELAVKSGGYHCRRDKADAELRADVDAFVESQEKLAKSKRSRSQTAALEDLEREVDELAVRPGVDHCRRDKAYAELKADVDAFVESQEKLARSKRSRPRTAVLDGTKSKRSQPRTALLEDLENELSALERQTPRAPVLPRPRVPVLARTPRAPVLPRPRAQVLPRPRAPVLARTPLAPVLARATFPDWPMASEANYGLVADEEVLNPENDTRLQPVLKLYDIMVDYGTAERYVIEDQFKSEPADSDWIKIEPELTRRWSEQHTSPASLTPLHDIVPEGQTMENIKSKLTDVNRKKTEKDDGSGCTERNRSCRDMCDPLPNTDAPAERTYQTAEREGTERKYRCTECQYSTDQHRHLIVHMSRHPAAKPNQCKLCNYKTAHSSVLRAHMRGKHMGITFKCEHCDYKTSFKCSLLTHTRKHTGETFNCELCDYKSTRKSDLLTHTRKHTGETFNCEHCDYKSIRKRDLLTHMKTHRPTVETFTCEHCDYKSYSKYSLLAHMRKHTGDTFNCEHCDYKSNFKCCLLAHMRKHTGETFNCEHCDYKSNFKTNLLAHIRKHTGETFNCEYCDYKSNFKANLLSHTRKHTGETFNCEYCDYKSNFKTYLVAHARKHTGETFNCEHCLYQSTKKTGLLIHMRIHSGETFNCEQCDYKSHFKTDLRAHMRKHTGETFNCEHCDYKSIRKLGLLIHMKKHTAETFNREQCE